MKWILIMILGVMTGYVRAQEECPVVTCMTWGEASMTALKERKMVFVAVGVEPGDKVAQQLFADEAVRLFLRRHAVGIGMDMTSEEGHFFEPKLLMYPWPAYAFLCPMAICWLLFRQRDWGGSRRNCWNWGGRLWRGRRFGRITVVPFNSGKGD